MEDSNILEVRSYFDAIANGRGHSQLEEHIFNGLKIIHLEKGIFRCKLCITDRVSREDGVLDTGAVAVVVDIIGVSTVYSIGGDVHVTLTLNSSIYSTEEVEIEGKVIGTKGKLKAVMVQIRRDGNGEVIARGNLWVAPLGLSHKDLSPPPTKSRL